MKVRKNFIINWIYYILIICIVLTITYIVIKWLLPVVFSLLVVMILQPIISHIQSICRIKNKFFRAIIAIVVYCLILGSVLYILFLGTIQIYFLLNNLPEYISYLYSLITKNDMFSFFNQYVDVFYDSITAIVNNCTTSFIDFLILFLTKLPSIMFDILFVIVSSLFFIIDYEMIKKVILKVCYKKQDYIISVIGCIKSTLSTLFKAYFIIFIITFIELLLGFYIINVDDALMIAFAIAAFDFFPILGVDMIFIPWIVIGALTNQISESMGLLVVYGIIVVTKNIVEPKLLSTQLGIHPLFTLLGMFLGIKLMGVMGMIVMPIALMVIKKIYVLNKEETDNG